MTLPLFWRTATVAGSQWSEAFTLFDDDGTLMDISSKAFEFAVRPSATDSTVPPLVKVTATPTVQGYVTISTVTATVQVVLAPAATALLGRGVWTLTLWMNFGLSDATAIVEGPFYSRLVAAG